MSQMAEMIKSHRHFRDLVIWYTLLLRESDAETDQLNELVQETSEVIAEDLRIGYDSVMKVARKEVNSIHMLDAGSVPPMVTDEYSLLLGVAYRQARWSELDGKAQFGTVLDMCRALTERVLVVRRDSVWWTDPAEGERQGVDNPVVRFGFDVKGTDIRIGLRCTGGVLSTGAPYEGSSGPDEVLCALSCEGTDAWEIWPAAHKGLRFVNPMLSHKHKALVHEAIHKRELHKAMPHKHPLFTTGEVVAWTAKFTSLFNADVEP